MQNRYTGDVGDFGKFALLSALSGTDLTLGVMWYLNEAEEANSDGRFTKYEQLRPCADVLYAKLSLILQNPTRCLSAVEAGQILPSRTLFYREPLPFSNKLCLTAASRAQQMQCREAWFMKGFQQLSNAELVFLDPDNGVAGKKVKKFSRKGVKYAFFDETTDWLKRNQSVIVYQHQKRQPLQLQVSEQLKAFERHGHHGWALSFHRQSVRIYFILPATTAHRALLWRRSQSFLETGWGTERHFRLHPGNHA
jgi:hypothetical protein